MFSGRFKWFYNVVVFNTKPASDENVDAVSGGATYFLSLSIKSII